MKTERIFLDPSDDRVYIDTYIADDRSHTREAMLVIPGGGYSCVCSDREGEPIALAYVAQDMNAFVLNYRVGREGDCYPKQLIDASRAILCIRARADEFGIDPAHVYCVGFSAGGHLAGSLATMFDAPEVRAALGIAGEENRPDAAVLAYPVTTAVGPGHFNSFRNLLGKEELSDAEKRAFSLECHVSERTAPIFIWHTAQDKTVPPVGSLMLEKALLEQGIPTALYMFPYGPHGMSLASRVTSMGNPAFDDSFCRIWLETSAAWLRSL